MPSAQATAPHVFLDASRDREARILADAIALIETESPSSDPDLLAESARAVSAFTSRRLGVHARVLVEQGISHVLLGPEEPEILLLGHHDTVWPRGTLRRLPADARDGILTGPGCFDMITGIVQAVHALAILQETSIPDVLSRVGLLITGDEEVGSATSLPLITRSAATARAVLVLEAAAEGGALKTSRKGLSSYRVTIIGRAAHAGLEPHRGANAGIEAARIVLALPALADGAHETTVTPTTIVAGSSRNTVPDRATLDVDVRAWTSTELDRIHDAVSALTTTDPECTVTVTRTDHRPPLEPERSEALYRRAVSAAAGIGIARPESARVGGCSDGNLTASLGVATLDGLGAVGGGAHGDDEHVEIDRIAERTALLAALVADLLRTPTAP